jgi:outer membrane protein TolC
MKKFLFFCFILSLGLNLFAQQYRIKYSTDDKDPLSLENAIRLAIENNYQLLLTEQDVIIAEQKVKEAKFLYLPRVSLNASASAYNLDYPTVIPENLGLRFITQEEGHENKDLFYGAGVSAVQYLYTGGRTSSTVSLAKANLKEALSRYEAVKSKTIYEVKEAFFNSLFLEKKKELFENTSAKLLDILNKKNNKTWENILIKSENAKINSSKNFLNEDIKDANLSLLKTLNKELNITLLIQGDFELIPVETDLKKLSVWAMEFRPELKSALYKLEMDNISVNLSLARRYPDVLLGASYERLGLNNIKDENMQLTLALRLPLGYDYTSQIKQKRAEQRQTILKQAEIEDKIRIEVAQAYNKLMFWQQEAQERQNTWESISNDVAKLDFNKISKEEAIKVYEYYYKSGVNYLEAILQHKLAIAGLELAVGRDIN